MRLREEYERAGDAAGLGTNLDGMREQRKATR
jgi:hypothetical protein